MQGLEWVFLSNLYFGTYKRSDLQNHRAVIWAESRPENNQNEHYFHRTVYETWWENRRHTGITEKRSKWQTCQVATNEIDANDWNDPWTTKQKSTINEELTFATA